MKTIKIFITILCCGMIAMSTTSCREKTEIADNINIPGLGGTDEAQNEMDKWIFENFTKPYNIEVVYRWDAVQMYTKYTVQLAPIKYDYIMPLLSLIKNVWFDPYIQACDGDSTFLKLLTPKKVVLVGSPEYQSGSIKLGQAEGGRKILLLNANNYDPTNEALLKQYLHTIEHEFVHIMHQTKMYNKDFGTISSGFYKSSGWTDIKDPEPFKYGFTRNYGMSGVDEDFTEVASMIMVFGTDWFENTVIAEAAKSTYTDAVGALREKEAIVVDYMKNSWGIQFYDNTITKEKGLVTYVKEAVAKAIADATAGSGE